MAPSSASASRLVRGAGLGSVATPLRAIVTEYKRVFYSSVDIVLRAQGTAVGKARVRPLRPGTARAQAPAAGNRPSRAARGGPGRLRPPPDARDATLSWGTPTGASCGRDVTGRGRRRRDAAVGVALATRSDAARIWAAPAPARIGPARITRAMARVIRAGRRGLVKDVGSAWVRREGHVPVTGPTRQPHGSPASLAPLLADPAVPATATACPAVAGTAGSLAVW